MRPALTATVSSATSVGSPSGRQSGASSVGANRCASLHSTPAVSRASSAGSAVAAREASPRRHMPSGAYPVPETLRVSPPGRTSAVTVISLQVSVPVLSVQITVVEPSVSTAESRRTTACRRAMRCTPTASAMVMATGNPSGTMPTT
jgi:hypothetical protein